MTAALTQRERLASLEAGQEAHATAHDLTERIWAAKLDAIDARLRGIERVLLEAPIRPQADYDAGWRPNRRDIAVVGGSAGLTSLAWWLAELVRAAAVA